MRTAEQIFSELQKIPFAEQEKFFGLLAKKVFHDDDINHNELLGDLEESLLTAKEAADYLDVSLATLRRYIRDKKINSERKIGTNHLFSIDELRDFKLALMKVKYSPEDIKRIAKENPDLPYSFIQDALISMEEIKRGKIKSVLSKK